MEVEIKNVGKFIRLLTLAKQLINDELGWAREVQNTGETIKIDDSSTTFAIVLHAAEYDNTVVDYDVSGS